MRLYLLRHSIADHPNWSGPDAERPLNDEGIDSLRKYGRRLTSWGVNPGLILHSPYLRASQTAAIVARGMGAASRVREDRRIKPGFSLELLGRILEEHAAESSLMLVGHNPDFEEVASALIGGARIKFGKGAMCCIETGGGARPTGTLKWFATRRLIARG